MKIRIILIFGLLSILACRQVADKNPVLSINISVAEELQANFPTEGRLVLFVHTLSRESLITSWPSPGLNIYAKNHEGWNGTEALTIEPGKDWVNKADFLLEEIPEGTYYLQLVWDHDRQESRLKAAGNMYSSVVQVDLPSAEGIELKLTKMFAPLAVTDNELVKEVELRSEVLSEFWGKDITVKASILLPNSWYDEPTRKYPVRYNIAGYGGRYTRVNRLVNGGAPFLEWWMSDEAPQIINVFLDGEGPFGDSYQLDSDNSGPYGTNLIEELIPHIESEYRALAKPEARFVDGCSTGGWVSLALQLYYPDFFNGVWSYSPDAVEFEHYQLVNVYDDENAYYAEAETPNALSRNLDGEPTMMVKDFLQFENVLGWSDSYVTSGSQFSAHTALYSPKGKDGLPAPMFDPITGKIDRAVAEHWKKYDMKLHLQQNWPNLGPKLQGKIYIWMGDMDHFYLNMATHALDDFLKQTQHPTSDATVIFAEGEGHCAAFDHRTILEMMGERVRDLGLGD